MSMSAHAHAASSAAAASSNPYNLKPGEHSSGTTIMAVPFEGGVVMGADSRTSTGTYIAVRVADKITQVHDRIWICRSGSAADTQALTDYVRHYLGQLAVETGRAPTVKVAAHLMRRLIYENKDNLMAGVIVGGWDPVDGGSVYNIPLGGTVMKMPFGKWLHIEVCKIVSWLTVLLHLVDMPVIVRSRAGGPPAGICITPYPHEAHLLSSPLPDLQPLADPDQPTFTASLITSSGRA